MMSAGEAVGTTVFAWAQEALGVTINEMFGQTEMNYIVGNSHTLWPAKPGSMGRPYPGHRIAVLDEDGKPVGRGEMGEVAVNRVAPDGAPDPVFFLEYFKNPEGDGEEIQRRLVPHRRSGARRTTTATSGTRDGPTTCSRPQATGSARPRSRIAWSGTLPSPTPPSCRVPTRHAAMSSRPLSCSRAGHAPSPALEEAIQRHVRKYLAPYEYPKEIEFIAALPMTTTGKVQRRVLRQRELERKTRPARP